MKSIVRSTALAAASAGSAAVARLVAQARPAGWPSGRTDPDRWRCVTVFREIGSIGDQLPAPLAELGDAVEVRLMPAPGDRGTEIGARLTGRNSGVSAEQVREALRKAKQLLEVGYVLEPDRNPPTEPTAMNAPLRWLAERARGEGRL